METARAFNPILVTKSAKLKKLFDERQLNKGPNSAQPVISETDQAPNVTSKIDEKEKYKCETKGGYYSKVLGCFEQ